MSLFRKQPSRFLHNQHHRVSMALRDLITAKKRIANKPRHAAEGSLSASGMRRNTAGERFGILQRPVVSEKASRLSEAETYAFFVPEYANKIMIKRAAAARFEVDVVAVRLMHVPYKKVRRGRITGWKSAGQKKALVTIRKGQKIELS